MTSGQKTAVSLLTSLLLFAAFTVFAFTGIFSVIDARFYEPGKISQIQKHLDVISENYNEYISELENRFGKNENSFLKQKSVLSYIENNPSDENVKSRSKFSGDLFSQTPALLGMRLIDKNGSSIHFSTFSTDVLNRTAEIVAYKNYTDSITLSGEKEISFEAISCPDTNEKNFCKTVFDGKNNRIIISFPFYDSYAAFRGSFVFYVNANDFNRVLLAKKIITFGDTGNLISGLDPEATVKDPQYISGFVFGLPSVGRELFEKEIIGRWEQGLTTPEKIIFSKTENTFGTPEKGADGKSIFRHEDNYWILISTSETPFGYVGGVYPDEIFAMPETVKILLLICTFVSVFLIVFLIINLKQDDMVVARERIKKLQFGLVKEYLKKKENVDWKVISGKIAERRQDVTLEILRGLGRRAKKHDKEVKELIDKSYDELLTAMNVQVAGGSGVSDAAGIEQIKKLLEEILSSGAVKVNTIQESPLEEAPVKKVETAPAVQTVEEAEVLEEVEELDDAEPVEEVEPLEEVEELDDAESVEEAEPLEEVEELDDAEPVEEAESLEEVEELDDAEPVEEAEPLEEVEELDEAEPVEEAEPLVPVKTEDVSLEAFDHDSKAVLHRPEPEIESSEDVEKINRSVSSFAKIYNKDDDQVIDNFSISNPDFTGLDDMDSETIKDGSYGDESVEEKHEIPDEEVSLDEFDVKFVEEEKEFEEEIGFGEPESKRDEKVSSVEFNVEPDAPDFESLDEKTEEVKIKHDELLEKDLIGESNFSIKNIQDQVKSQALVAEEDIEELSDKDMDVPFTLTSFCDSVPEPVDLEEDYNVIQEDDSGVFVIHSEGHEKQPVDMNFKELVDSVLFK